LRVTHQSTSESVIQYLRQQTDQSLKAQETIATGRQINRPSDDPQAISQILNTRQVLSSLDQYQRNIIQAELRIHVLETTLAAVNDLMDTARGLGENAGENPDMQSVLADQVSLIRDQVIQLANTRLGDIYLFAGHSTDVAPFQDDGTYLGDSGSYHIRVGQTSEIMLKADGDTVFKTQEDIFSILEELETALETNDSVQIQNQTAALNRFQEHLRTVRADIGITMDQLEVSSNYLDIFAHNMENYLGDLEEADITEAVLALQLQNTVYEAALAAAADLLQTNLIQFLR